MLHATALARGEIVTQMGTCPTKFTCPLTTLAKLASYLHICYGLNNSSLIVGLANVYFFSSIFDTAQVLIVVTLVVIIVHGQYHYIV